MFYAGLGPADHYCSRARTTPPPGGFEPLYALTSLDLKSSPNPIRICKGPVAERERAAQSVDLRLRERSCQQMRGKFLPQRNRIPRQTASFKGLAAQSACPGLCPVAWGAL